MLCNKCGKEINPSAKFCNSCGSPVNGAASFDGNSTLIFQKLLARVIAFFTKKDAVATIADSVNDNSFSGLVLSGIGILLYALSEAIHGWKFWNVALYSFIEATVFLGMTMLMIRVTVVYMHKKQLSWQSAINVTAYAALPLYVASVVNIVLRYIPWSMFSTTCLYTAFAMFIVLLYAGISKAIGSFKDSFWAFVAVICSAVLSNAIVYQIYLETII